MFLQQRTLAVQQSVDCMTIPKHTTVYTQCTDQIIRNDSKYVRIEVNSETADIYVGLPCTEQSAHKRVTTRMYKSRSTICIAGLHAI